MTMTKNINQIWQDSVACIIVQKIVNTPPKSPSLNLTENLGTKIENRNKKSLSKSIWRGLWEKNEKNISPEYTKKQKKLVESIPDRQNETSGNRGLQPQH